MLGLLAKNVSSSAFIVCFRKDMLDGILYYGTELRGKLTYRRIC